METPEQRFWRSTYKTLNCWFWIGARERIHGEDWYGHFQIAGKTVKTHRFSWSLHYGPIPPGVCVLHSCDNPQCVNPKHLFLGTRKQNSSDCISRGRHSSNIFPGEKNGRAVLTEQDVHRIRYLYSNGWSPSRIANILCAPIRAVQNVSSGKRWRHLLAAQPSPQKKEDAK